MREIRFITCSLILGLTCGLQLLAQTPATKHYAKDGLSFDYPADWQLSDQSSGQMQFIQLGYGGVEIRIRAPRELLKSPPKEAEAKKIIQDKYVDSVVDNMQQQRLRPNRSKVTTQIGGGDAEGARVRAVMDNEPGGMDSYFRVISDRLVQLSIFGSEKEITRSAPAWDIIRKSIAVAGPQPEAPSPKKP